MSFLWVGTGRWIFTVNLQPSNQLSFSIVFKPGQGYLRFIPKCKKRKEILEGRRVLVEANTSDVFCDCAYLM